MPTPVTIEYVKPKSWDEFEDMVWHITRRKWNDPEAKRYGSPGQAQQGVDIYGFDHGQGGLKVGLQCKRYEVGKFTPAIIEEEIVKAEGFKPPLEKYVLATTDNRDAKVQEAVRLINQERKAENKFTIEVLFWEDLCSLMAEPANRDILEKFYRVWPSVVADPDVELIKFYSACLSRPAFKKSFHAQRELVPYDEAIKDTITALNAGLLFDRETREVLFKAKGKSFLTNPKWRAGLDQIDDLLYTIRETTREEIEKGIHFPKDSESVLFIDESRKQIMEIFNDICEEAGIPPLNYYG